MRFYPLFLAVSACSLLAATARAQAPPTFDQRYLVTQTTLTRASVPTAAYIFPVAANSHGQIVANLTDFSNSKYLF